MLDPRRAHLCELHQWQDCLSGITRSPIYRSIISYVWVLTGVAVCGDCLYAYAQTVNVPAWNGGKYSSTWISAAHR